MTDINSIRHTRACVVHEEFVALTGGLHNALVLNQCLYWSQRTAEFDLFIQEESRQNPQLLLSFKQGWFYKTFEDLNKECMLSISKAAVSRIVKELINKGWLETRNSQNSTLDQSAEYRVNLLKIQADLANLHYSLPRSIVPALFHAETPILENEKSYKGPGDYSEINLSPQSSPSAMTLQSVPQQNEREMVCTKMLVWFEEIVLGAPLQSTLDYSNALWKVYQEQLGGDLSLWEKVCHKIVSSSFLMGESKNTNFKPTINWFLKSNNVTKVLHDEWVTGDRVVKTFKDPQQDLTETLHAIETSLEPTLIKALKRFILENHSLAVFKSWFASIRGELQGNEVVLYCLTGFIKDRIASEYASGIRTFLQQQGYTLSLALHQQDQE